MNFKRFWEKLNDRLGLTIFHPQYFCKIAEHQFVSEVVKIAHGTFLDIGCGRQWYRNKLEKYVTKYYAMDHPVLVKLYQSDYPVEILADASNIPLKNNSLDMIMMIMVLEHLPNPGEAISETHRLLKKGGILAVFSLDRYPSHYSPHTYTRWTRYGLDTLFVKAGFTFNKLVGFGNFYETQAIFQNVYLMLFIKRLVFEKKQIFWGLIFFLLLEPLMMATNLLAFLLGRRTKDENFALGHFVFASKK